MPNNAPISFAEDPDHMIIWLDEAIGDPGDYIHLKASFSSNADPKNETPVKLVDRDYDELLRRVSATRVNFEGDRFLLAAFTNVEQCVKCFEENQDKRIFFITSGSLGETAVPIILERFRPIFTDPETGDPYTSIYVFCHIVELQMRWALDYDEYIQIFDHEQDLLVRIIRDIAAYYVTQSKRLLAKDPPHNLAAYHRLIWARELYQRYSKMENVSLKREFAEVNQLLEGVEEEFNSSSDEDD